MVRAGNGIAVGIKADLDHAIPGTQRDLPCQPTIDTRHHGTNRGKAQHKRQHKGGKAAHHTR
jgi:hypothetical protein